jgi:predicted HD phosphohydrolase
MTLISGTSPHVAQPVLPSVQRHVQRTIEELFGYLAVQGNSDYLGEQVSQLEHSLQCAHLATMSNADAQTILAALLHDVGRFISLSNKDDMPAMLADDGKFVGRLSHEVVGERYLRALGFGEKVCQLVGGHVQAKRYLTAVDKRYYDSLSKTSKTTLKYQVSEYSRVEHWIGILMGVQGGPFNDEQVREAQKDPWLAEKLAVRKWDDEAKVAGVTVPGLDAYRGMAINCLEGEQSPLPRLVL